MNQNSEKKAQNRDESQPAICSLILQDTTKLNFYPNTCNSVREYLKDICSSISIISVKKNKINFSEAEYTGELAYLINHVKLSEVFATTKVKYSQIEKISFVKKRISFQSRISNIQDIKFKSDIYSIIKYHRSII